jgi:hypothetical protein
MSDSTEQSGSTSGSGLLDEYDTEPVFAAKVKKNTRTVARWRELGIGPAVTWVGKTPIYSHRNEEEWLAAGGTAGAAKRRRARRRSATK